MKRPTPRLLASIAAAAGLVALAACGTATPYQPLATSGSASGGYSEYRITSDRYRVSFQGNSLTERETVERYLLFRAAELAAQEGYDWFALADRDTERQRESYTVPRSSTYWAWQPVWYQNSQGQWRVINSYQPYWIQRDEYRESISYMATAEIFLGRGAKPANDPRAFEAREVIANLGPTIRRPEMKT